MTATMRATLPVVDTESGPMAVDRESTVGVGLILPGDRTIEMSHAAAGRLAAELDPDNRLDPNAPRPEQYQAAAESARDRLDTAAARAHKDASAIARAVDSGVADLDLDISPEEQLAALAAAFLALAEAADTASDDLRDISIGDVGYYG